MTMHITSYNASSILSCTSGFLDQYMYTLNMGIGCPFGRGFCGDFCYAQSGMAHRFHSDGHAWGDYLKIKANAPELLQAELRRASQRPEQHSRHVSKITIFASSSTDPCAGPMLELFRRCLQVIASFPIQRIVIQTRAPQVVQLKDEIEDLGPRGVLSFTIETDSDLIWQTGPKGAPGIHVRRRAFEAMKEWRTVKHLAVSPCLKLVDPHAFADWIAATADVVTVDTFVSGDGSPDGSRTSRTRLPILCERQGWDWRDESDAKKLLDLLRERMGDRVAWSSAGFNRLAYLEA